MKISNNIPQEDAFDKLAKSLDLKPFQPQEDAFDKLAKSQQKEKDFYVLIKNEGSIADRHNNPGNLIYAGQEGAEQGEKRDDSTYWAKFESPKAGFDALVRDIEIKQSGKSKTGITGESTIEEYFAVYAPAYENDTTKIINEVTKSLGVSPKTQIKEVDRYELAKETAKWESSTKVFEPEEPKLSFQKMQELNEFEDLSKKYTISDATKSAVNQAGLNPKTAEFFDRFWDNPRPKNPKTYKTDLIESKLNAFGNLFPELKEEADDLKSRLKWDNADDIKEELSRLEGVVMGTRPVGGAEVAGMTRIAGAQKALGGASTPEAVAPHKNWYEYKKTVIDNPAYRSTERLIENTEYINNVLKLEEEKEGTMLSRWFKGVTGEEGVEKLLMPLELPNILKDNAYVAKLADKVQKATKSGEEIELSADEERTLMALQDNIEANFAYDPQRWTAYNWGAAMGSNIGFLLEFGLTSGIRKATTEAIERYAVKNILGKSATTIQGFKNIGAFESGLAKLAGTGVQAIYMPSMWQNMALDVSNGKPKGQAFMDSWYKMAGEVFSESLYMGKLNNLASNPGLYHKTLNQIGSALAGKRGIRGVAKGLGEEFLEEKINEIWNAGEKKNLKEFLTEFTSLKSNVFTMGAVASMTGILGSPMIASDAGSYLMDKIALNDIKQTLDKGLLNDINLILDDKNVTVGDAYSAIFNLINTKVRDNKIKGNVASEVAKAIKYATLKTRNNVIEQFAGGLFDKYRDAENFIRNMLPVSMEKEFADRLRAKGIEVPENNDVRGLLNEEVLLKGEKDLTEEEKAFVDNFYTTLDEFRKERGLEIFIDKIDESIQQRDEAELKVLQAQKELDELTKTQKELDIDIKALEKKKERTESEDAKLEKLKTLKSESEKKFTDLDNILKENEKKLADKKSFLSEYEEVEGEQVSEKFPKSETAPEGEFPKKETLQPKNIKDLEEVSRKIFGEKDEKKVKASAVVMDILIGNMAKRAGMSKAEMYSNFDFTKISPEELLGEEGVQQQKGLTYKGASVVRNGRNIIYAMTSPDVSTPMHEMAHAFEPFLATEERDAILAFAGEKQWTDKVSETFAKGFERYLAEGVAPNSKLKEVFENFKNWLLDIYRGITKSEIDIELNQPMRDIYGRMLAEDVELKEKEDGRVTDKRGKPEQEKVRGEALLGESGQKPKEVREAEKPKGEAVQKTGKERETEVKFQTISVVKNISKPIKEFDVEKGEDKVTYFTLKGEREKYRDKFGKNQIQVDIELKKPLPESMSGMLPSDAEDSGLFGERAKEEAKKVAKEVWTLTETGGLKIDDLIGIGLYKGGLIFYRENGRTNEFKNFEKTAKEFDTDRSLGMLNLFDALTEGTKEERGWNYDGEINPYEVIVFTNDAIKSVTDNNGNKIKIKGKKGVQNAEEVTPKVGKVSEKEEAERGKEGQVYLRDNEKARLEAEKGEEVTLGRFMPSSGDKGLSDSARIDVKKFTKSLEPPSFAFKGLSSLNIPSRRMVFSKMLSVLGHDEIFNPVISFIPIEVMDVLTGKKFSSNNLLHNKSMFIDLLSSNADNLISHNVLAVDILARTTAFVAAITNGSSFYSSITPAELLMAYRTNKFNHLPKLPKENEFNKSKLNIKFQTVSEPVIPADVLKKANDSFLMARAESKLSEADAAVEAVKVLERSDWYKKLSKEEQEQAKVKFSEITERWTTRPTEKKTKEKTPLEASTEEIKLKGKEALIKRIQIEKQAIRDAVSAMKGLFEMLKEAQSKDFITYGQFISIIRRLSEAKDNKKLMAVYEYAENVIAGAEYKDNYSQARTFLRKIAKKKIRNKFGTASGLAQKLSKLDISLLTPEELKRFNEIAKQVGLEKRTPDVRPLPQLVAFLEMVEEEHRENIKETKQYTIQDVRSEIEELQKLIETGFANRAEVMAAQRKLNRIRKIAEQLLQANEETNVLSSKDVAELQEALGEIKEKKYEGGELEQEIKKERDRYYESIIGHVKTLGDKIKEYVKTLPIEMQKQVYRVLSVTRQDLDNLKLADIESLDRILFNLSEGYLTPTIADIEILIGRGRLKETVSKFFEVINKSKQWQKRVEKHKNDPNFQDWLIKQMRSIKPHRLDTWFGNYNRDFTIGSLWNYMGRGVSMESKTVKMHDERLRKAHDAIRRKYSKRIRQDIIVGTTNVQAVKRTMQWIGFLLTERSYRGMPNYIEEMADENSASLLHYNYIVNAKKNFEAQNNKKRFPEEVTLYNEFMEYLKANNATKMIGGVEVADIEKAEELLRQTKEVADYIDTVDSILSDMRGMAEWSTYMNGRSFIPVDPYFPFVSMQSGRPLSLDEAKDMLMQPILNPKMTAGSTHERMNKLHYINTDPTQVMKRYIKEIARNYNVHGEIRKVMGAVMDAGIEAEQKGLNKGYMNNITRAIISTMRYSLDRHYHLNDFKAERDTFYNKFMTGLKKGMLATIHRVIPEFTSNVIRATVSIWDMPVTDWAELRKYEDVYSNLIEDYIGERYMSRWGEEIRRDIWSNKYLKFAEDTANWIITFSDTSVGRVLFVNAFKTNFKKVTGRDFDIEKYRDDFQYRVDNERAVESSAVKGVRKVEELFNDKAPLSTPTLTRFMGGLIKAKPTNKMTQFFDFLQSFNRNEVQQIIDSVRRYRYSTEPGDRALARKDIAAIILSNAVYNIMRDAFGVVINTIIASATGAPEDEWTKEEREKLSTWKHYWDELLSATASIALGGSTNIYLFAYKWLDYLIPNTNLLGDEDRKKIREYMADQFYVRHIDKWGSARSHAISMTPVPSAAPSDIFNWIDDISIMISSIDEGEFDQKTKTALIEFWLLGIKYAAINPVTPTAQKFFNRYKSSMRKKEKDGKPRTDVEELRHIRDGLNSGGWDEVDKQTDELRKIRDSLND